MFSKKYYQIFIYLFIGLKRFKIGLFISLFDFLSSNYCLTLILFIPTYLYNVPASVTNKTDLCTLYSLIT